MTIAATAPRGGLAEELAGASRVLILRNAEIERFEDRRGSVFALWDAFFGRGTRPAVGAVRDLVALGLVGGGMSDQAADALVTGLAPEENPRLYEIAQGLLGVAFMPDAMLEGDDAPDAPDPPRKHVPGADEKKKTGLERPPADRFGGAAGIPPGRGPRDDPARLDADQAGT